MNKLQVGDLVNFSVKGWIFKDAERRYKNPGIILKIKTKVYNFGSPPRLSADVLWADGKVTTEHEGYVTRVAPTRRQEA